jgi:hypothetical protein
LPVVDIPIPRGLIDMPEHESLIAFVAFLAALGLVTYWLKRLANSSTDPDDTSPDPIAPPRQTARAEADATPELVTSSTPIAPERPRASGTRRKRRHGR